MGLLLSSLLSDFLSQLVSRSLPLSIIIRSSCLLLSLLLLGHHCPSLLICQVIVPAPGRHRSFSYISSFLWNLRGTPGPAGATVGKLRGLGGGNRALASLFVPPCKGDDNLDGVKPVGLDTPPSTL